MKIAKVVRGLVKSGPLFSTLPCTPVGHFKELPWVVTGLNAASILNISISSLARENQGFRSMSSSPLPELLDRATKPKQING